MPNFRSLSVMTLLMLSACTRFPTVETTVQAIHQDLKKGDHIIIYTRDDVRYEFNIMEITQEYIISPRQKFAFDDIQKIEKPEASLYQPLDAHILPWVGGVVAFLLIISML